MSEIDNIKSKYNIIKKLARAGDKTVVYVCEKDSKKYIIKVSCNDDKDYAKKQQDAISKQNNLVSGYNGNVRFPNEFIEDNHVISEYMGIDFDKSVFDSLSKEDKIRLEKDFADFLAFIHSKERYSVKSYSEKVLSGQTNIEVTEAYKRFAIESFIKTDVMFYPNAKKIYYDIGEKYKSEFSSKELDAYNKSISSNSREKPLEDYLFECKKTIDNNSFLNGIIEDKSILDNSYDEDEEILSLTHRDLRFRNVLYDNNTGSLGVIDFETSRVGNVYKDFVPARPNVFGISYEFWFNVINYYNEISEYKISFDKILKISKLGIFYDYVKDIDTNNKEQVLNMLNVVESKCDYMKSEYIRFKKGIEDINR